jgi:hypothetical protein
VVAPSPLYSASDVRREALGVRRSWFKTSTRLSQKAASEEKRRGFNEVASLVSTLHSPLTLLFVARIYHLCDTAFVTFACLSCRPLLPLHFVEA